MKNLFFIILLFTISRVLFANIEEGLVFDYNRYIEFLSKNVKGYYDAINSPENREYILKYRDSLNEYIKRFEGITVWQASNKIRLSPYAVNVYPMYFTSNRLNWLVTTIDGIELFNRDYKGSSSYFYSKLSSIDSIGLIDIDGDNINEVICISRDFLYILRLSKGNQVYVRSINNVTNIQNIFQIGRGIFGIVRFDTITDKHSIGRYLCKLEWTHPGFGISKILKRLRGMTWIAGKTLYELDTSGNRVLLRLYNINDDDMIKNTEYTGKKIDGIMNVFSYRGGIVIVCIDKIYSVDLSKNEMKYRLIFKDGLIKNAFKVSDSRIYVFNIGNELFEIIPPEKRMPIFAEN